VNLVEEEHTWRVLACTGKEVTQGRLGLTHILPQQLRSLHLQEVRMGGGGYHLCQEGLAAARRSEEQHPLGRLNSILVIELGPRQRQLNRLAQCLLDLLQSCHVVPGEWCPLHDLYRLWPCPAAPILIRNFLVLPQQFEGDRWLHAADGGLQIGHRDR